MYIQKVVIENIRSIAHFEMEFPKPAGWHVLIGDNGAGKSSIVRAMAAVLTGPDQIVAVLPVWEEWIAKGKDTGNITLEVMPDWSHDRIGRGQPPKGKTIINKFHFSRNSRGVLLSTNANDEKLPPTNYNWGNNEGWFSVAYGPFRRFTGGDNKRDKVFFSAPKAGAHLSVFGEDIALTEALDWLKEIDRKRLKELESFQPNMAKEPVEPYISESEHIFQHLKTFINQTGFLPHNAQLDSVGIDGELIFLDGNGNLINVTEMSDGYRSILSLTFELIRQLVRVYGGARVFYKIKDGELQIDLPGVVLIDEIDAHLHPAWQTRIGQWFTKYFSNIQFIVSTHSPLICRACEKGSIWRLTAPGSEVPSGEITGTDKDRLIFGNILDAYGTEVFGENTVRSTKSEEKLERLGRLNMLSAFGKITKKEEKERQELQKILATDAPTGF